jgi:hypothetical protein
MTMRQSLLLLLVAILACLPLVAAGRRLVGGTTRARHHEVGSAVFLQLGAIYAVLLAFIFNEVYGEYVVAAQAINKECASLHAAALLADTLPEPARGRTEQVLTTYLDDVIRLEWPAMATNRASPETVKAEQRLVRTVAALGAGDPATATTRGVLLEQLAQAHESRETRLFEMTLDVPGLIWVLLLCFSLVLVTLLLLADVESFWPQATLTAAFVGAVAFLLIVIRLLDSPFSGPLSLSRHDFERTLVRVQTLTAEAPDASGAGAADPARR